MIPSIGKTYFINYNGEPHNKECAYIGPGIFSGIIENLENGEVLYHFSNLLETPGFTSTALFSESDILSEINI